MGIWRSPDYWSIQSPMRRLLDTYIRRRLAAIAKLFLGMKEFSEGEKRALAAFLSALSGERKQELYRFAKRYGSEEQAELLRSF